MSERRSRKELRQAADRLLETFAEHVEPNEALMIMGFAGHKLCGMIQCVMMEPKSPEYRAWVRSRQAAAKTLVGALMATHADGYLHTVGAELAWALVELGKQLQEPRLEIGVVVIREDR